MSTETIPMVTATQDERDAASKDAFLAVMKIVREELNANDEQRSTIINLIVAIENAHKWSGFYSGYAAGIKTKDHG